MTGASAIEDAEQAFWRFSLAVYASPGVPEECLRLQDDCGVDVNLLLFVSFIGAVRHRIMTDETIAAAADVVGDWHADVVKALRAARRALKPYESNPAQPRGPDAAALRGRVKAAELEAERLEQAMLSDWARRWLDQQPEAPTDEAVAVNVSRLLLRHGLDAASGARPATQQIIKAAKIVAAANEPSGGGITA